MPLIDFPSVPDLPGVPALIRPLENQISGKLTGLVSGAVNGPITGTISGLLGGSVSGTISGAINGTLSGTITKLGGNLSGSLTAALGGIAGGDIVGSITGSISGAVNGAISSVLGGLPGGGSLGGLVSGAVGDLLDTSALADDDAGDAGFSIQWGIYSADDDNDDSDGAPVIVPDTILAHEVKIDSEIASHPVEQGQFASYNKVDKPGEIMVQMACSGCAVTGSLSGGASSRTDFLSRLDAMAGDLNLYRIVTPDTVYEGYNLTHYDTRRTSSNGVSLIVVNCRFQQVRTTAFTTFTQTARPDGQQAQSGGQQSAQPPMPSQLAAIKSAAQSAIKSGLGGVFNGRGATGSW